MNSLDKKNICFFCGDICQSGGTERVTSIIASELVKTKKYNIFILSLTKSNPNLFFQVDDGVVVSFLKRNKKLKKLNYFFDIINIRKFLNQNKIDVIIDVDIVLDLYTIPAIIGLSTKLISWENFNLTYSLSSFRRKLGLKLTTKFSDKIVTLTKTDMRSYIYRYNNIKNKIDYISNPITINQDTSYNVASKQIITVGKFLPIKGYDLLVDVASNVLTKNPEWKWIILGDGPEFNNIKKLLSERDLTNKVLLKGTVKNPDFYYSQSSIFVLTSKNEGFGLVLLEAKIHKLPIVCFDIKTGVSELVKDNINGYVIERYNTKLMAQKINDLIVDLSKRKKFSNFSSLQMENYKLVNILVKWEKVIDELTGGSK